MAIKVAMIVRSEAGIGLKFAGEQAAGQRNASENADLFFLSSREEQFGGPQPEAIENDLYRLHVGKFDSLQCFFDFLHTDAVVAEFSGFHQIIQDSDDLRAIIQFRWRAVELEQINCVR